MLFVVFERRHRDALVPLHLFALATFTAANAVTLLVYGALGAWCSSWCCSCRWSPGGRRSLAGLATLPVTLVMLLLSSRAGALAARIGPRLPMSVGRSLCGAGLLLRRVGAARYLLDVLPGVALFALGLVPRWRR